MLQAFKLIWKCDRNSFLLKLFYTLCTSLLPVANLYVLKMLVDAVTQRVTRGFELPAATFYGMAEGGTNRFLLFCIFLFCLITLANRIFNVLSSVNNDKLTQKLIDYINNMVQTQSVRLDMAFFDNPDYHDTFHRAQQEAAFRPIRILENTVTSFGAMVSLVGVLALILSSSWVVVVVMVVAAIPSFCVRLYKSRRVYTFRRETTQLSRRSNYYGSLLSNRLYAKEVRVFELADYFRKCYVDIRRDLVDRLMRISRRLAVYDSLCAVIEVVALACILLFMVGQAVGGAVTLGAFVMLFEAFRRGQGYLTSLVSGVSGLYDHKLFISNLFEFLELQPSIVSPRDPKPFPEKVQRIDFDNITFAYPGMVRPVLDHYSLTARQGEITRIEGENGFGKTTLLKLLLRLYDPDSGAVRINGVDIREFDVHELRRHVSAIFQDYVQFYFTMRENITFGDMTHAEDARRLAEAIRLADAQPVVQSLSKGLDTPLGRQFDGGEELSMGQWQRVALARQLYSGAPVLLFDEPTAWMDASARKHFYESLETLKTNRIVILVSHMED